MRTFRFRASAALDLRKRQEDAAAVALARAEAVLRQIAGDLAEAERVRLGAQTTAATEARAGTDTSALEWHRNWIVRLSMNVSRLIQDQERQRQAFAAAEAVWREARRKRLALDRMRERGLRRFDQAQTQQDMKTIDELARLRYVALAGSGGEES